ncbi:MAG: sigma-70 family RNA polymerase sigma factor [Isosphaeraceae bacterium]
MRLAGEAERPRPLSEYLDFLRRLAVGAGVPDASDLVQETVLHAHRHLASFRGTTDAELKGWLRAILAQRAALAARRAGGVPRTIPLGGLANDSGEPGGAWIVDDGSSPSQGVHRTERRLRLAEALALLPEAQRAAVELRYLIGMSVDEVAARMGRSVISVTGLIYRGTRSLREILDDGRPSDRAT